jgi:hypothetical protein
MGQLKKRDKEIWTGGDVLSQLVTQPDLNNVTNSPHIQSRGTTSYFFCCCSKRILKKTKKKKQPTGSRLPRVASLSISARVAHHRTAGGLPSSLSRAAAGCAYFHIKMYLFPVINIRYISLSGIWYNIYLYLSNIEKRNHLHGNPSPSSVWTCP